MMRSILRRLVHRTPPARTPLRRAAHLGVEPLESRDLPSGPYGSYPPSSPPPPPPYPPYYYNSPTMIRAPYTPFGSTGVVGHEPPNAMHAQAIAYSTEGTAVGNTVTAWVHSPMPLDEEVPGNGLYFTRATRQGVASAPVLLEGFDLNPSDGYTSNPELAVDVGVAPDGGFAVAYVRHEAYYTNPWVAADWGATKIYVRVFSPTGAAVGGPILIDQYVDTDVSDRFRGAVASPEIGADAAGGFTVAWRKTAELVEGTNDTLAWRNSTLFARRIGPNGGLSAPTAVATFAAAQSSTGVPSGDTIYSLDLATDGAGRSVVAWSRMLTTYLNYREPRLEAIYASRIDAAGAVQGGPITVSQNADAGASVLDPRVAVDAAGGFAVAWPYYPAPNGWSGVPAGAPVGNYVRRFNAAGPVGNEILIPPTQSNTSQLMPNVAMDPAGNFVVAWIEESTGSARKLQAQAFTPAATPRGTAFTLFSDTNNSPGVAIYQSEVQIDLDADGDLTAAWGRHVLAPGYGVDVITQNYVRADFDVQRGQTQRSTVQYVDVTFNPGAVDLAALTSGNRLRLFQ